MNILVYLLLVSLNGFAQDFSEEKEVFDKISKEIPKDYLIYQIDSEMENGKDSADEAIVKAGLKMRQEKGDCIQNREIQNVTLLPKKAKVNFKNGDGTYLKEEIHFLLVKVPSKPIVKNAASFDSCSPVPANRMVPVFSKAGMKLKFNEAVGGMAFVAAPKGTLISGHKSVVVQEALVADPLGKDGKPLLQKPSAEDDHQDHDHDGHDHDQD